MIRKIPKKIGRILFCGAWAVILILILSCFNPVRKNREDSKRSDKLNNTTWVKTWEDDFSSWIPGNWNYDLGNFLPNSDVPGWGNNELQNYTDSKRNAFVENGVLTIRALKETSLDPQGRSHPYSSARIKSTYSQTYGKIEVRAKLPPGRNGAGKGIWPAVWMLPTRDTYGTWAASGEIDILETRGRLPEIAVGSIHFGGPWPQNTFKSKEYRLPKGESTTDWHVYSLIWDEKSISWYVDGREYARQTSWHSTAAPFPAPFNHDFHLIMNVAVGGNFDGNPDDTTGFPAEMQIDYVRFYRAGD